jgi:hypothetical protein
VEFATWIGKNNYTKHQVNDRWYDAENFIGSTEQLYKIWKAEAK